MYKTIWKFPLTIVDYQKIEMPRGACILCCQYQNGPQLWAVVDPEAPKEDRFFRVAGTGHPINTVGLAYIDTVQIGQFVWHVFENTTEAPA